VESTNNPYSQTRNSEKLLVFYDQSNECHLPKNENWEVTADKKIAHIDICYTAEDSFKIQLNKNNEVFYCSKVNLNYILLKLAKLINSQKALKKVSHVFKDLKLNHINLSEAPFFYQLCVLILIE